MTLSFRLLRAFRWRLSTTHLRRRRRRHRRRRRRGETVLLLTLLLPFLEILIEGRIRRHDLPRLPAPPRRPRRSRRSPQGRRRRQRGRHEQVAGLLLLLLVVVAIQAPRDRLVVQRAAGRVRPQIRSRGARSRVMMVLVAEGRPFEQRLAGARGRFVQRRGQAVQGAEAEDAAQGALAAPAARRRQRDEPRDGVLVVVDPQPKRAGEVVVDQLAEPGFAVHVALGRADDVVPVRQQARVVGGRVRDHVEDVPDVLRGRDGGPLQRETQRGRGGRDGDLEGAHALAFCAPDRQGDGRAGAVADLDGEGVGVWVVDLAAVDADDEIVPGLEGYIGVFVAEDLEAEGAGGVSGGLRWGVAVEAGNEAV